GNNTVLHDITALHINTVLHDNNVLHDNTVLHDNNVIEQLMACSDMDLKMAKTCYHSHFILASAAILPKWGVTSIKSRNQRSRIDSVTNAANVEVTGSGVSDVFVSHYESFIGSSLECDLLNTEGLFNKKVLDGSNMQIMRPITNAEIKTTMFDIGDDKALGPDVYTSMFFKKGRDVVGADVCKAIHDLFSNGKLLKEINHTFMTLIPKIATPQKWRATNGTMTDFSVKCSWEVLRPRGIEVPWLNTVWFSHAIPRHEFHLWLVMRRSLKTQDKLRQWDVAPTTDIT
ncbi:protein LAZ1, partial [Tanacetum coccineum]